LKQYIEGLSLLVFVGGFALSVYVFLVVQVLQSYPFHQLGAYGSQPFLFLTYSETIEAALPVSVVAFAVWEYERMKSHSLPWAALKATGKSLVVFGSLVAATVYTEIHLVWGELWYGVHVWSGLLGGGGYPWGDEQVAYNLCFVKEPTFTQSTPNCYFLNYNWLLGVAIAALMVGVVIELYFGSDSYLNRIDDVGMKPQRPGAGAAPDQNVRNPNFGLETTDKK
jgi:hypothetical protein